MPHVSNSGHELLSLIATHNLTLRLNGQTVLEDINIAIEAGEIVTIVGQVKLAARSDRSA